jgi:hypothetical protein
VLPTLTYGLEEIWEFLSLSRSGKPETEIPQNGNRGLKPFCIPVCIRPSQGNLPDKGPGNVNDSAVHTCI